VLKVTITRSILLILNLYPIYSNPISSS
jgi:hypothetical protein